MVNIENNRQRLQEMLDEGKTSEERNRLGQFATPYPLAVDIMEYVATIISQDDISFLEPAIGTGVFYSAFLSIFGDKAHTAQGYEIDPYYIRSCGFILLFSYALNELVKQGSFVVLANPQ